MNLYEELELPPSCTEDDIKKQYRRMASIHHPDKGGNEEKFKRLQIAYEVLSNSIKRKQYDHDGTIFRSSVEKSEAIEQLLHSFNFVVDKYDPATTNIIEVLNFEINNLQTLFRQDIQKANIILQKLVITKDKLIFLGNTENMLHGVIDTIVETKTNEIKTLEHRIKICINMLEILKEYSYGFLALTELRY